ncbi:MAG: DUF721 domain-containing protein [bacterium]|nr:DUF721 domain-containing protein [bacterium]
MSNNHLDSAGMSRYDRFLTVLKRYAKAIEILDFSNGTLFLEVASTVYSNEITMRKFSIIKDLNQYSKDNNDNITVRNIKILVKGRI